MKKKSLSGGCLPGGLVCTGSHIANKTSEGGKEANDIRKGGQRDLWLEDVHATWKDRSWPRGTPRAGGRADKKQRKFSNHLAQDRKRGD